MKKLSLAIFGFVALTTLVNAVSPEPPFSMELDEHAITTLSLNEAIETLLIFPSEIRRLSGRGLTTGKEEGVVQYGIGNIKNVLHLKPLEAEFDILAKVMLDESVYVFRLRTSNRPSTVIRLNEPVQNPDETKPPTELNSSEVVEMTRLPSLERQKELIRLVWEEHKLRPQLPELYANYRSRDFNTASDAEPFYISLDRIGRFFEEDCLVVRGRFYTQSTSEEKIPFDKIQLNIGNSGSFPLAHTMSTGCSSTKDNPVHFIGILVGDGVGNPGHYRLENNFSVTLEK